MPDKLRRNLSADSNRVMDKEEIGITIRSILTAFKHGCPVSVLTREYFEACGQPLPYRQFGYANATELLQAMPDVARFGFNKIGENVVFAVSTGDTEHVAALVRRQKSAPLKPSAASKPNFNQNSRNASAGVRNRSSSYNNQPKKVVPSNEQENRRGKGHAGGGGHTGGFFPSRSSTMSNGFSNGASNDFSKKVENFVGGGQFEGFPSSNPSTFCNGSTRNHGRNKAENYSKDLRNFDGFPRPLTTTAAVVTNGFNASTSSNDVVRNKDEQRKIFNETLNSNFSTNSTTAGSSMDDGFSTPSSTATSTTNYQNLRQKKMKNCFAGANDVSGIPEHMLFKTIIPVSFSKQTQRNDEYEKEISDLVNQNVFLTTPTSKQKNYYR